MLCSPPRQHRWPWASASEHIPLDCFRVTTVNLSTLIRFTAVNVKRVASAIRPMFRRGCAHVVSQSQPPWEQRDVSFWHRLESVIPCSLPCFLLSFFSLLPLFPFLPSGIVSSWILDYFLQGCYSKDLWGKGSKIQDFTVSTGLYCLFVAFPDMKYPENCSQVYVSVAIMRFS